MTQRSKPSNCHSSCSCYLWHLGVLCACSCPLPLLQTPQLFLLFSPGPGSSFLLLFQSNTSEQLGLQRDQVLPAQWDTQQRVILALFLLSWPEGGTWAPRGSSLGCAQWQLEREEPHSRMWLCSLLAWWDGAVGFPVPRAVPWPGVTRQ